MKFESQAVPIGQIEPNRGQVNGLPANPRFIRDDRFSRLKKSIEEDPEFLRLREVLLYPITADGEQRFVTIAGEMRYRACRDIGMERVPAKILPADTPVEMLRQWAVKDNAHHGEWDMDVLGADWGDLPLEDWGIDLPSGWNQPEPGEATSDDYEVPPEEEIETDIKPGDLIQIGGHLLLCGDCTNPDNASRLMGSEKADMVFTDPPYNIAYSGGSKKRKAIKNDHRLDEFAQFLGMAYDRYKESLKPGGAIYVCHADTERETFTRCFRESGFKLSGVLVWVKDNSTFGRSDYHWRHEPILYGWNPDGPHAWHGDRKQDTVWEVNRPSRSDEHPTMKPVELVGRAIHNSSLPGEIVADFFLGSGTSMVAAHQMGRVCRAMELEPKYCQVAINRMRLLDPGISVRNLGNV